MVSLPFIVACEGEVVPPDGEEEEEEAPPAIVPEGELVVLRASLANEVWGVDIGDTDDREILGISNEHLVYWAREGQEETYYPGLAERWELSPDGLTYDFYLRKGIPWHDGWGEFTAEDVKYTFDMIAREGSTSKEATRFRVGGDGKLESVTVVDPYHFRVKLLQPDVLWLFNCVEACSVIICKKYFETVGYDEAIRHPIGTGPWRFIEHKAGEYIRWEAVENHWRKTPDFKYLEMVCVPELSTRLAMLKTGAADLSPIPPANSAELKAAGLTIKSLPAFGWISVALGGDVLPTRKDYDPTCPWVIHQDEPLDSAWNQRALKVRKALCYAINYNAIIDVILKGAAKPTPLAGYELGTLWSRPEWKPYPYDPEQAKQLLAEAGYPNGFEKPITFDIFFSPGCPQYKEMALAICDCWEAIGIKVERNITEYPAVKPVWSERRSAWRVSISGFPTEYPEPWYLHYSLHNPENPGLTRMESYAIIELVEKCRTPDFDERVKATLDLGDYLYENFIDIGIAITDGVFALSPKVAGWTPPTKGVARANYEYVSRAP